MRRVAAVVCALVAWGGVGVAAAAAAPTTTTTPTTPTAKTSTTALPATVRVAVRPIAPFVIQARDGELSGFSVDLARAIAAKGGVRLDFVVVRNVQEQLQALQDGRADAAIGAISITARREDDVDFSQPMFQSGIQIAVTDKPAGFSLRTLAEQLFTRSLLVVIVLIVVGTFLTGTIVWLLERRRENQEFSQPGWRGVFDGIWWSTVTLFTIGYGDKVPRRLASRLIAVAWMFCGILLVATLTAEVTAGLTVEQLDQRITKVSDLAGKRVVSVQGTTSGDYLESKGIEYEAVDDIDQAYDEVAADRADAVVYDAAILRYQVAQRGGVRLVGDLLKPENYGIAFPNGSALREPVNRGLLSVNEDGTYGRLVDIYFN